MRFPRLLSLFILGTLGFSTLPLMASQPADTDATVLLLTSADLAPAWQEFADWKTKLGKPTKIVTVDSITDRKSEDSIQEQIRKSVQDHIKNHGTRWLVLGGDCLPGGKGVVPGGHTTVHAQERAGIPTDIVYLSKTDWDGDGDGVYGEWPDDQEAITYPDGSVGLGRIPLRTAADVKAFTNKVIAYESRYPTTKFAERMTYTCTERFAYPKVRQSWDKYVSKAWESGKADRFFSSETPWDDDGEPGSYPLSAENLVKLINGKTCGKLHIHGHGHLPLWVLERSQFTSKHIGQLKNDGAYPLITTVSCHTGEFDSKSDPSIVEQILRAPNAGSVAVVAPVRTGKPHFAKRSDFRLMVTEGKLDGTTLTMTRYWKNGLGEGLSTGMALMKSKSQMAADAEKAPGYHLCICELNLLGDPTLDMRAAAPRNPELGVAKEVKQGKQRLAIKTDAPGATVCVWKQGECYEVAQTDDSGNVTVELNIESPGEMSVAVSGNGLNARVATVKVK